MLRWEVAGDTGIVLGDRPGVTAADAAEAAHVPGFVRQCALPIVVFSGQHAAVRGTATLLRVGDGVLLLTAAHLFDDGVRLGDLALPLNDTGAWVTLASAQLVRDPDADIALVIPRRAEQQALARRWQAVPVAAVAGAGEDPEDATPHYVAGYPAALTRRAADWLVAKRLLVMTGRCQGEAPLPDAAAPVARHDLMLEYRRVAARTDGTTIHTPELEGVSGAAVWGACWKAGERQLMIVGVQSAFRHSRYMRVHRTAHTALLHSIRP